MKTITERDGKNVNMRVVGDLHQYEDGFVHTVKKGKAVWEEGSGGGVTPEQLAAAIAAYFEQNPIPDELPTVTTTDNGKFLRVADGAWTAEEGDAYSALPSDTASGAIASFPDGAEDAAVKSLVATINPVQSGSGDPSPDNVRPITGFTGCKVSRTGKNLLPPFAQASATTNGVTLTNENGEYTLNGTATARASFDILVSLPAGVYTLSANNDAIANGSVYVMSDANTVAENISLSSANKVQTFIVASRIERIRITVARDSVLTNVKLSPVLTAGSTGATAFEHYQSDTYTIAFPSEAGTVYGGTLDAANGVLTVDSAIVDMGSISYSTSGVRNDDDTGYTYYFRNTRFKNRGKILSSQFKTVTVASSWKMLKVNTCIATDDFYFVFCADYPNAESFKAAMSGVQLLYELANPVTYQLDPVTVTTLLGVNNIWADTGDVAVDYRADTGLYIRKLTGSTEEDMIADAPIASGKYFLVGNTLYLSTAEIAAGATLTPGTNCVKTNLAEALNALNS